MLYRCINAFNALGAQLYFKGFLDLEFELHFYSTDSMKASSVDTDELSIRYIFGNYIVEEYC